MAIVSSDRLNIEAAVGSASSKSRGMLRLLRSKRGKFILGAVVVLGIIGYLVYAGIRDTRVFYLSPTELLNMGEAASGEGLRLGGIVAPGSTEWDSKQLILKFRVTDGTGSIAVMYRGVVPDTFRDGGEIVVEGTFQEGLFTAATLMPKCPSKYEAAS